MPMTSLLQKSTSNSEEMELSSAVKGTSPLPNHGIKRPGAKYSINDSPEEATCGSTRHSLDVRVNVADKEFSDISEASGEENPVNRLHNTPYKRIVHTAQQSMLAFMAVTFIYILAAIIVCCPILGITCFMLPVGMAVKHSLDACGFCCSARTCRCYKEERLSHSDVMLLHETQENKAIFQTMLVLEGGLQIGRLRDIINSRLICAQNENGRLYYPRFKQKVVSLCCGYVWMDDLDFNISNHIRLMPSTIKDCKDLQEYISHMSSMQLSFERPLWEIQVLESFGEKKQMILLLRTHPSLSDGISLVKIFHRAVSDSQSTLELKAPFGSISVMFNVLRSFVIGPLCFLTCLFGRKDKNKLLKRKLSGKKVAIWTEPFSLFAANKIQQITRTKLGDIFLSVTAGGIRFYLQSLGDNLPTNIKATIPVDLRENDNFNLVMGNIYANVPVQLPVSTEGAIPRLWDLSQMMEQTRDSALPVILYVVWWNLCYILPLKLSNILQDIIIGKTSCIVSNLPGPNQKMKVATKEVKSIVYWTPTRSSVGLSVSFFTYGNDIRVGILADEAVVPDPKLLAKYLSQQINSLESMVANRRLPGEHSNPSFVLGASIVNQAKQPTMEELQSRISAIQSELTSLKAKYETADDSEYTGDREQLAQQVEVLKKEFDELLSQTKKKRESSNSTNDGTNPGSTSMADVEMSIEFHDHQHMPLEQMEMEDDFSPKVERKGPNKYSAELKVSTL
ncbi:uncharacterized protein LOC106157124 isoform X2 [Lingula anatina]|uniref:Uncharacterized protein LOC106157124 isoform X2 n=1 Tax=Lingula anatina TaxID=7574 RepID=A0A1S3HRA4_LINAN|nr:uncharacterized protein LOC106157124 isoform X2 [Lingula anatina]|eukprot:XP_013388081.1 uncharacterized protein LOC106157124 isoform X2 [Lingula anatina]